MAGMAKGWSLVNSSGCPTARSGHCVTVAKDELYLFGGCGHPGARPRSSSPDEALPICLGDLHVFDVARQRWREISVPAGKTRPAQRTCAAICASEEEDRLFLSGGAGDDPHDLRGDLLEYDVRERTWSVLHAGGGDKIGPGPGPQSCPFRRIGHTMVHHSTSNRLVLFGGSTGLEYFDDVHAFDLATGSWTLLATMGDRPSPRYKHQAFIDADFMYVIGGGSYEPEGPDLDVYRLALVAGDAKALKWERLTPTGSPPRCRAAHGLAWDRVGRAAYVWGGFTSGMELDSTFCALRLPPTPTPSAATPPPSAAGATFDIEKPAVTEAAAAAAAAAARATSSTAVVSAVIPSAATDVSAVAAAASQPPPPPAATAAAPAPAAAGDVDEHQEPGSPTEAVGMSNNNSSRNRRTLSADAAGLLAAAVAAAAAAAREYKPSGSASGVRGEGRRHRASASGTELAEQLQWQEDPQHEQLQQPQPQPQPPQQHEHQQHQQHHQSPPLPLDTANSRTSPGGAGGADGRDRWRRRGQRLWRQGSGAERGGDSEGRARRPRGGRRRSWGQGWASGRLQGLWGGGGTNDTEAGVQATNRASPPAPSLAAALHPLPVPVTATAAVTPAVAGVAGEELSWVSLPSGQAGGASRDGGRGALPNSSPAGRSFHCAFFHGGACYVTGGSDGARKFGDMWRFPVRESPASLTTLAARAVVSKCRDAAAARTAMAVRESAGREQASPHTELLEGLPQELRECLSKLNMQAEVVL
eukprot:g17100.t1